MSKARQTIRIISHEPKWNKLERIARTEIEMVFFSLSISVSYWEMKLYNAEDGRSTTRIQFRPMLILIPIFDKQIEFN